MKPKLIVVAYHMGRVGSSALMGLLNNMGIYVGDEDNMPNAGVMNPKGFFELVSQREFLSRIYKDVYPDVVPPPKYEYVEEIASKYFEEYRNLLDKEFRGKQMAAVKSQRMLTLPMLGRMSDVYDIKVVVIERDISRQAQSTKRVWDQCNKGIKWEVYDISRWIMKWKIFSEEILRNSDLERIYMRFESIIDSPVEQAEVLARFLDIDSYEKDDIAGWIDKNLVNRGALK